MINRWFIIPMLLSLSACIGKHDSSAQKATISDTESLSDFANIDTMKVNLSNSTIHWKGTEMRGAGKHEGDIQLQSAFLLMKEGKLQGGVFVIDMHTISVSDIPEDEPIARKNLINHLKSNDFFDVEHHPTAKFEITDINPLINDSLSIAGNLTIRGINKNIRFKAHQDNQVLSAQFTIDRFQWNIAYEGSWADKTLIDKAIELTISISTRTSF